jgi:hypothetical protein
VVVGVDLVFHRSRPLASAPCRPSGLRRCASFEKRQAAAIQTAAASKTVGEPIHQPKLNHKAASGAFRPQLAAADTWTEGTQRDGFDGGFRR